MALGAAERMDPHELLSFPPEDGNTDPRRADEAETDAFVFQDDLGFDMRVGIRKRPKTQAPLPAAARARQTGAASVKVA